MRRHVRAAVFCAMLTGALEAGALGGAAGPRVRTDRGVYPMPKDVKQPKANETYVDPVFGTTILRVTGAADGKSNHNAYSYWPALNRDNTYLHAVIGGRPTLCRFDADAFRITGKEPLFPKRTPQNTTPRWEDSFWSGVRPNILFGIEGTRIWSYDVEKKEYALVKDLAGELPPGGIIAQMSKSLNDMVFGFTMKDKGHRSQGCIAWRRDTDKVVLRQDVPGLDEVQVDKSGRFCLVKTGKQGKGVIEVKVADLATGRVTDLVDNAPDFAPGHSDNGHGVVIGADNWRNTITFRHLAAPHEHRIALDFKNDWSQGLHVSMRADDGDWALVSLYKANRNKSSGVFMNELVLAATDGSGRVRRLAHHRSVYKSYWDSPRACISRDGRFVVYTSNWGVGGRRDVYILKVSELPAE